MPFKHGTAAKFYWHDLDFTPYLERIEGDFERGMGEARPLAAGRVVRVPGFRDFRATLAGLYDGAAAGSNEFAWERFNEDAERPFSYLPHGDMAGGVAFSGVNDMGSESLTVGDDVLKLPIALVASESAERCRILAPLAERLVTGEGTSVDNGAATTAGGVAILHCMAIDPATTLDAYIEHSVDDLNWELLAGFTQIAASGSERIVVPDGTTVRRYLRAGWTLTGDGATFFVAFGRR